MKLLDSRSTFDYDDDMTTTDFKPFVPARRSERPGDFLVVCSEDHLTSFADWERMVLCSATGEAEKVCPRCGCNEPTMVSATV